MLKIERGGLRIFRLVGIDVYVHWLWLVVALYEVQSRRDSYSSQVWNVAEYLSLFAIVLLHEFGHALACRSVGGRAERILLWPFGGVAYVDPPQRPGAILWSIAAGPLVNVVLLAPTIAGTFIFSEAAGFSANVHHFFMALAVMNVVLLVFNMLPSYPLDGGQILRSVLWYFMGPVRSLRVVSVIGMLGAVGLALWALKQQSMWLGFLAFLGGVRAYRAFQQSTNALAQQQVVSPQAPPPPYDPNLPR